MGTGWRRAFCTTIPTKDRETAITEKQPQQNSQAPSPRNFAKLAIFSSSSSSVPTTPRLQNSSSSNSSTPRLESQTPNLRCRTTTAPSIATTDGGQRHCQSANNTPRLQYSSKSFPKSKSKPMLSSNPSSPRSPFSILKSTLRLSRNGCGVCLQSVKTGQGMAIYTAECSHTFHFPCIAAHVRKQGSLFCPVCNVTWKDVPLLSVHKNNDINNHHSTTSSSSLPEENDVVEKTITAVSNPSTPTAPGSNRIHTEDKRIQQSVSAIKIKPYERPYNDDEPLCSPTAGARFNPIPEADEGEGEEDDENEDVAEFQGFFVNPTPSAPTTPKNPRKDAFIIDNKVQRNVEVKLLPETAVVSLNRTHETCAVVLRVKAPPPPPSCSRGKSSAPLLSPSHRAPIDLVTVLDVSGSMTGTKLQMLKRAMRLVISSLGSADRLSIVAFAATPQRLLPLKRMTAHGQQLARRIIDQLGVGQGTCVKDALRKATKVLEDRREKNPVASIMLLSDGQEESIDGKSSYQQRQTASSHVSSTRFSHIEIPVHSFGYGGRRSSGGYSHEPTENAFAKCVGGLLSVVVQDLKIQLGFTSGSAPAEITAVYSCNGRPTLVNSDSILLGDLYAEEERELLIELKVPTSSIGSHHVMSVRCSYKDPPTQELMYGRERALLVPRPHTFRSTDPRIERLRNVFIATRAVAESTRLVEHNDFSSAHHLLSSARALLMRSNLASADEHVRGLEAELGELHLRRQYQIQQQQKMMSVQQQRRRGSEKEMAFVDENGEPLTPTSAWRAAEQLAKVAMMKKSMNRVGDLHGFENARF